MARSNRQMYQFSEGDTCLHGQILENLPGKAAVLPVSIDFLAKATYTNKIQHTHMEEPRNA